MIRCHLGLSSLYLPLDRSLKHFTPAFTTGIVPLYIHPKMIVDGLIDDAKKTTTRRRRTHDDSK